MRKHSFCKFFFCLLLCALLVPGLSRAHAEANLGDSQGASLLSTFVASLKEKINILASSLSGGSRLVAQITAPQTGYLTLHEFSIPLTMSCGLPNLSPNEVGKYVTLAQIVLKKAGYYDIGYTTQFYGKATQRAVAAFQKAKFGAGNATYQATGIIDQKTATALNELVNQYFPAECAKKVGGDPGAKKKNIVLILTDDQRWDTLWAMPKVQEKLVSKGVNFVNGFVSTPLCCPDRASLLSGGYFSRNVGVLTNEPPNGGAPAFLGIDRQAMPVELRKSGYATGLFGKYMNFYNLLSGTASDYLPPEMLPYVPPGWDNFYATPNEGTPGGSWLEFDVIKGKSGPGPTVGAREHINGKYLTDYFKDQAINFMKDSVTNKKPFFVYFATHGPHLPAMPAPGDENLFSDYTYNSPAYNEQDISDKPWWVGDKAREFNPTKTQADIKKQLQSLASIDRSVDALVETARSLGVLDDTVFIFTSDNGLLWGEHQLVGKLIAYEESIRVPLVVAMPGGRSGVTSEAHVYSNLDIGATIFELAGVHKVTDGLSLLPFIKQDTGVAAAKPRGEMFYELIRSGVGGAGNFTSWSAVKWITGSGTYKYVEYVNGDKEFYNLTSDPNEEQNAINESKYKLLIVKMAQNLEKTKTAVLVYETDIVSRNGFLRDAQPGVPYSYQFQPWKAIGEVAWSWKPFIKCANNCRQNLPPGLNLDEKTGLLSGTPQAGSEGLYFLQVKVQDKGYIGRFSKKPFEFIGSFKLRIVPSGTTSAQKQGASGESLLGNEKTPEEMELSD